MFFDNECHVNKGTQAMTTTPNQGLRWHKESGQTMIITVLALGTFLLAAAGFGVDVANLWYHRQAAQTAADATCTAGVMDVLYQDEGEPAPAAASGSWSWIGQDDQDCSGHYATGTNMWAPCWYAAQNGYSSGAGTVVLNYPKAPTSVSGVSTCSSSSGTACLPGYVPNSLLQVNVKDAVRVFFMGMVSGKKTVNVGAQATCGVVAVQSPVPLLVLDPRDETSVNVNGKITIAIYGGPTKSIQVNSSSTSAVVFKGASGSFDLSQGGPSTTGSSIGVTGAEAQSSVNLTLGSTGSYIAPSGAISDPFATICAPGETKQCQSPIGSNSTPAIPTNSIGKNGSGTVGPKIDGCPADGGKGGTCLHFVPGLYSNGISVKNNAAVFDPGVYYVSNGMTLDSNSEVCAGSGVSPYQGDGSSGATFYFVDNSSISVNANSGGDQCTNSSGNTLTAGDIKCTSASTLPGNMASSTVLNGNILLAPCSGYYGDPLGTTDPSGEQRGILFFQNRGAAAATPQWGGGGAFTLAGAMYFHYCDNATEPRSGENCDATNGYTDVLTLQGVAASGTYILGDIEADQLSMGGNPTINMDLSSTAAYYILKATLLQ